MITRVKEKYESMNQDGPSPPQHELMSTIAIWIVNVHESILQWMYHQSLVVLLIILENDEIYLAQHFLQILSYRLMFTVLKNQAK
ncbi:40S ribosomal protein S26, variant 2 [Dermatophagoides farinae]|uniref:40S ribosomal protein S26, variant 2 n=1 Tax=Dermatophagoides farinae TaxID=6954 RepID=A0A922I2N8_DERFA|nr:40S ribosomal protein S26, variant 2 [Dermatophagoides farinae]